MKETKCVNLIVFPNRTAYIAVKPGRAKLEIDFCSSILSGSSLIKDIGNIAYYANTAYVNIVEEDIDDIVLHPYMPYQGKIYAEMKESIDDVEDSDGIIPLIISFHCPII